MRRGAGASGATRWLHELTGESAQTYVCSYISSNGGLFKVALIEMSMYRQETRQSKTVNRACQVVCPSGRPLRRTALPDWLYSSTQRIYMPSSPTFATTLSIRRPLHLVESTTVHTCTQSLSQSAWVLRCQQRCSRSDLCSLLLCRRTSRAHYSFEVHSKQVTRTGHSGG